jgi:hypothetical protein
MNHWLEAMRRAFSACLLLVLLFALASCGGGGEQESSPKRVARIEVSPASLVLTSSEPSRTLQVRALAEDGTEVTNAPLVYTSSQPQAVQVDQQGRVSALATVGSALVEVSSGDVVAAPVPVVTAKPKPGVMMIADDDIVGEPVLVEYVETVIGSRMSVTLRKEPAPAVGTIVLASEGTPLAGRVVEVVSAETGATNVVVEVVRLDELFDDLQIETLLTPDQTRRLAVAPAGRSVRTALNDRRAANDATLVRFGSAECRTDLGGALLDLDVYAKLEHDVSIRFNLGVVGGRQGPLVMAARYAYIGKVGFSAQLGLVKGELTCNMPLFTVPIPVPGFVQIFILPMVPIGTQLKGNVDFNTNAELSGECNLNGSLSFGIGFDESWQPLDLNGADVDGDCFSTPNYNPDFLNPRLSTSLFLGVRGELEADSLLTKWLGRSPVGLLEARAGFSRGDTWSFPAGAALDIGFTPGYQFQAVTEISSGESVEDWFKANFGPIVSFDFSWSGSLVLGRSPTATEISVDKIAFSMGEVVRFNVKLDPLSSEFPSLLGSYNVHEVRIYQIDHHTLDAKLIATALANEGQIDFELEWVADNNGTSAVAGIQTFYAFAVPRIWTLLREDMPLELGAALSAAPEIRPARAIAAPGTTVRFEVFVEGSPKLEGVAWSATGGSITEDGMFLAGSVAGDYTVTATDSVTGATSTSQVTIDAPPQGFFVTGTVLSEDGRPVAGARIDLVVDGVLFSTETEGDGLYRLQLTEAQYGRLPPSFVLGASNVPLHHPAAAEVKRSAGAFVRHDFVLYSVASNPAILSIELVPEVHHIGNSNYSGTQNSQFQYPKAEGSSFSKSFYVTSSQRSSVRAKLRLIAKGVQCLNTIKINGILVAQLNNSPNDGSYRSYEFALDPRSLKEDDSNTFTVEAVTCSFDMDDFEFAHAQLFFD